MSLRQRTLYYESFLEAGIAIAGYDLGEVRGSPTSTKKFTAFYEACPVLKSEAAVRAARLKLCDLVARTIAKGLALLGIEVAERM